MNHTFYTFTRDLIAMAFLLVPVVVNADYSKHTNANDFIQLMVEQHQFERSQVEFWLASAERQESIIKAMSRPAEKAKPWHDYRKIFVTETRTNRGLQFWRENQQTLERAEQEFGVDPAIIVSIIGVETNYGRNVGSYNVIDALSTLAFDYYTTIEKRESRRKFFTTQLEHLLLLSREQGKDPLTLKGSYAGAMGWGQFMPNSYRHYAVDYDDDNFADIWSNPTDAIGSVANYFAKHGWKTGMPVAARVHVEGNIDESSLNSMKRPKITVQTLLEQGYRPTTSIDQSLNAMPIRLTAKFGQEYWFGFHNFYVIGRYNPRVKYAMAVFQLSQDLRQRYCSQVQNCDNISSSSD